MAQVGQLQTPQQAHLSAVHTAQASAYHSGRDPASVNIHAIPMGNTPNTIAYEDEEHPPTRASAYYTLLVHQLSVYSIVVFVSLIIALSIVYYDTPTLRQDVSNNVRSVCKDVSDSIATYLGICVITGGFALLTALSWLVRSFIRHLQTGLSIMFLICILGTAVYNVVGTVYVGKPASRTCYDMNNHDSTEAYNMLYGCVVTLWITLGVPAFLFLAYVAREQLRDLAALYPSDRKLRESSKAERELLMIPPNPSRVFRYP